MKKKGVIVIGSGRLGANIASLRSLQGEDVLIVDKNSESFRRLAETFSGFEIIGDSLDLKVLEDAGIKHIAEIVVTTGNDNINILLSHVAHFIYKVPKITVRLEDVDKAKLLVGTPIKAIYPFALSMNEFTKISSED